MIRMGASPRTSGIWQRWSDYGTSGHGGNKKLKELLKFSRNGATRAKVFHFSVLEIADTHASAKEVRHYVGRTIGSVR